MAFFQDSTQPSNFFRVPGSVLALVSVLVLAHGTRMIASPHTAQDMLGRFAFYPARYSPHFLSTHSYDPGSLLDRAIPFVSFNFLHESLTHLAINCFLLLLFGSIVARRLGALLFFLFFILCGLAGAITYLLLNWGSAVPLIGASAAMFGLMGAGFRLIPIPFRPDAPLGPPLSLFSVRVLIWTVLIVAFNVTAGLTGLGVGPGAQSVAWQAHLGGFAAGLLLIGPFLELRRSMTAGRA